MMLSSSVTRPEQFFMRCCSFANDVYALLWSWVTTNSQSPMNQLPLSKSAGKPTENSKKRSFQRTNSKCWLSDAEEHPSHCPSNC